MALGALVAGCGKDRDAGASRPPKEELESALRPGAAAAALKKAGGAHFQAKSTFRVSAVDAPAVDGPPVAADAVTTTTDLWVDAKGHYRFVEANDHDGGREVILHGRDLAVGMRYGKLVRRTAQEPEPTRLLEEALSSPWAAWETVQRWVAIERPSAGNYRFKKADAPAPAAGAEATTLRKWRETIDVRSVEGEARLDPKSGALLAIVLKARFVAKRGEVPLEGELSVAARVTDVGRTAAVAAPAAEPLLPRQRTIVEERALLENLGRARLESRKEGGTP